MHTRETDFHTVEVDVDVDTDVYEAIRDMVSEISDVPPVFVCTEDGKKLITSIATPKGRQPGGPFYTMHRITIEKVSFEERMGIGEKA